MAIDDLILAATATFGAESIVADELRALGYRDLAVENGRVVFSGGQKDVARCNIWLRTADRVVIRMAHFRATDFGELFERTREIGWEDFIPLDGKMHVTGKSHKSTLFSVPDCQSIVKKAIVEAMKRRYRVTRFEETGPVYRIEVALLNDMATLTLDTTGPGLHKRGYRTREGGDTAQRDHRRGPGETEQMETGAGPRRSILRVRHDCDRGGPHRQEHGARDQQGLRFGRVARYG